MTFTRAALLRQMLIQLRRHTVVLEHGAFDPTSHSAQVKYEWRSGALHARIAVDLSQDGGVTCVIHELMHAFLDGHFESFVDGELKEYGIAGIEEGVVMWLRKHPPSWNRWRDVIGRKLEESG